MNLVPSRRDLEHFAEEVGVFFGEQWGLPPMAGRIAGWLMICDPPHQSAAEITDALRASTGSVSTMTQLLLRMGFIERVALPGERKAYFHIPPGVSSRILSENLLQVTAFRGLAERGLRLLEASDSARRARLEEMRDLNAFIERKFPALMEEWQQEFAARNRESSAVFAPEGAHSSIAPASAAVE